MDRVLPQLGIASSRADGCAPHISVCGQAVASCVTTGGANVSQAPVSMIHTQPSPPNTHAIDTARLAERGAMDSFMDLICGFDV